jgi:adenylate cyclase
MNLSSFLVEDRIVDLSFFNFRNAITAAYFADPELRILKVNKNFKSMFPILDNVTGANFLDVLTQLGVSENHVRTFAEDLQKNGKVLLPEISITVEGQTRKFSLLSTITKNSDFSYLNGVQGQFVDRTREFEIRKELELLLHERDRDRKLIDEKTRKLENLANRLAKYLSPQIYNSIFSSTGEENRGFLRKNLTVFFSDIEQFTDLSEGMEPELLAFVINTYLGEMSNIAIEHGGTIDKFIGDAVMIFFGDPETEGDAADAVKCAKMALAMQQRVKELQSVWQSKGVIRPLKVRMGIASGYCTVGNFGSEQRLDYTALGGPVNLASRLQDATEADTILVSEATQLLIKDSVDIEFMSEITPKGFNRPVKTYRLNGLTLADENNLAEKILTRVGKHVEVSIADSSKIREAIEELKQIQEEFENFPDTHTS